MVYSQRFYCATRMALALPSPLFMIFLLLTPFSHAIPIRELQRSLSDFSLPSQTKTDEPGDIVSPGLFMVAGMLVGFLIMCLIGAILFVILKIVMGARRILLTNEIPGSIDDAAAEAEEDRRALDELSPNDQELYFQAKDFFKLNPTNNQDLPLSQMLLIQEKGVSAWEFKPHVEAARDILVLNKTEVTFVNEGYELSIQSNFPIPRQNNEVYYFECKIYELPDPNNTIIEIGLATKPYPYFRFPGRHRYSISYDSEGTRHYNQPFQVPADKGYHAFPKLQKADVVGIGYRTRSGTVFFTRNGKKVSESKIGGHIKNWKNMQLYPTIAANNHCSIHANFGAMGYVFIEANVKKWGFGPLEGTEQPPPLYTKFNGDVLLESSDIDPQDLQLRNGDFPPDFFDDFAETAGMSDLESNEGASRDIEEITLHTIHKQLSITSSSSSIPPENPPEYDSSAST